ncbi:MAG: hypothetical protein J6V90_08145 [Treponema sp.]|nr:hypothetical protein [Treponema sp.]
MMYVGVCLKHKIEGDGLASFDFLSKASRSETPEIRHLTFVRGVGDLSLADFIKWCEKSEQNGDYLQIFTDLGRVVSLRFHYKYDVDKDWRVTPFVTLSNGKGKFFI